MILILSSDRDNSTNKVINWLLKWEVPFMRVSILDKFIVEKIVIDKTQSYFILKNKNNGQLIDSRKITAFWYRRDKINLYYEGVDEDSSEELLSVFFKDVNGYLKTEMTEIFRYLNLILRKIRHINSWFDNQLNKLYALEIAKEVGIEIPKTIIATNDSHLNDYFDGDNEIVTKGICQGIYIYSEEQNYQVTMPTSIYKSTVENPSQYFPTLFQNKIEKLYELRIFYFLGRFFTSAIFSQQNEKTKIDFRNYDVNYPNRTPPVKLPNALECKIRLLMEKLNLNSGSIDMVYTTTGEYIFLEVNPIGLFEQVDIPCNYNIEMEIAKYLKECTTT